MPGSRVLFELAIALRPGLSKLRCSQAIVMRENSENQRLWLHAIARTLRAIDSLTHIAVALEGTPCILQGGDYASVAAACVCSINSST